MRSQSGRHVHEVAEATKPKLLPHSHWHQFQQVRLPGQETEVIGPFYDETCRNWLVLATCRRWKSRTGEGTERRPSDARPPFAGPFYTAEPGRPYPGEQ